MKDLRIVFMGTPEFAVASLAALVNKGFNIVGVITAPDKPKGRGRQLMTSAVKDYALSKELNILQPSNLKSEDFQKALKNLKADLQIVVAFRMLPESVWSMPHMGTFNLHSSLLPQYRGAAPINWAIINGEKETGVTTFLLQHEIDTGNIILQEKEQIKESDNVGSLYERLMHLGAKTVVSTVELIITGKVETKPQLEAATLKAAPKLYKETCEINWDQPVEQVHNFIRGLSPYPAAWSILNNHNFKIFRTEIDRASLEIGQLESDNKSYIKVGCAAGSLFIKELQLQGKKRMKTEDFLRGNNIN
jgi:methionyl-tRNA formyltransferase